MSLADLPELRKDLESSNIQLKIASIKNQLINDRHSHTKLFKSVTNTFGLYDEILKRLVLKDTRVLLMVDFMHGLVMTGLLIVLITV